MSTKNPESDFLHKFISQQHEEKFAQTGPELRIALCVCVYIYILKGVAHMWGRAISSISFQKPAHTHTLAVGDDQHTYHARTRRERRSTHKKIGYFLARVRRARGENISRIQKRVRSGSSSDSAVKTVMWMRKSIIHRLL